MPNGTEGVAYSETLTASGGDGTYTWALFNATTLPAGLALNTTTGVISGTPSTAGTTKLRGRGHEQRSARHGRTRDHD